MAEQEKFESFSSGDGENDNVAEEKKPKIFKYSLVMKELDRRLTKKEAPVKKDKLRTKEESPCEEKFVVNLCDSEAVNPTTPIMKMVPIQANSDSEDQRISSFIHPAPATNEEKKSTPHRIYSTFRNSKLFQPSATKLYRPPSAKITRYKPHMIDDEMKSEETSFTCPPGEMNACSYDCWDAPGRVSLTNKLSNISPKRTVHYELQRKKSKCAAVNLDTVGWTLIILGLILAVIGIVVIFYSLKQ